MEHKCPRCYNTEHILIKGTSGLYGAGNCIPTNPGFVLVTRYVCTRCGYVEEWIDDKQSLEKLIKRFGAKGDQIDETL